MSDESQIEYLDCCDLGPDGVQAWLDRQTNSAEGVLAISRELGFDSHAVAEAKVVHARIGIVRAALERIDQETP